MVDRGRLVYEEKTKERRAQAELGANHIGIFISFILLILTWTVYSVEVFRGIELPWLVIGLILCLLLTVILFYVIDKLVRMELTQNLPIKVYERGILMPTTPFDRIIWRKMPFIHYNNLEGIRLIKAHRIDRKDMLIATTKQRRRKYPKRYDRNSEEEKKVLESVRRAFPQAKVEISE